MQNEEKKWWQQIIKYSKILIFVRLFSPKFYAFIKNSYQIRNIQLIQVFWCYFFLQMDNSLEAKSLTTRKIYKNDKEKLRFCFLFYKFISMEFNGKLFQLTIKRTCWNFILQKPVDPNLCCTSEFYKYGIMGICWYWKYSTLPICMFDDVNLTINNINIQVGSCRIKIGFVVFCSWKPNLSFPLLTSLNRIKKYNNNATTI